MIREIAIQSQALVVTNVQPARAPAETGSALTVTIVDLTIEMVVRRLEVIETAMAVPVATEILHHVLSQSNSLIRIQFETA